MTTFTADRLAVMASDLVATRREVEWMGRETRLALLDACGAIYDGDYSAVEDSLYSVSAVHGFARVLLETLFSVIEQEDYEEGLR